MTRLDLSCRTACFNAELRHYRKRVVDPAKKPRSPRVPLFIRTEISFRPAVVLIVGSHRYFGRLEGVSQCGTATPREVTGVSDTDKDLVAASPSSPRVLARSNRNKRTDLTMSLRPRRRRPSTIPLVARLRLVVVALCLLLLLFVDFGSAVTSDAGCECLSECDGTCITAEGCGVEDNGEWTDYCTPEDTCLDQGLATCGAGCADLNSDVSRQWWAGSSR